jgi:NADPH:quinone reductase
MQALELRALDGPDGLALTERPEPIADGGVVIDVRTAGVSFPDLLVTQGRYQIKPELPWVPGQEVAGVVREAPAGADVSPGDRVWASLDAGGFAGVAVASPGRVYPLAPELTFEEGAALGVNYLTAVFALGRRARLRDGETVLVLGAAGGLGTAVVGVAKASGARVVAVVSTGEKVATAQRAGADEVVVGASWRDEVLALTGGRGIDVTADIVGGGDTLQAVRATAPEGRVVILGFTSGEIASIAVNRLLLRNVELVGAGLGAFLPADPEILRTCAATVLALVAAGLRPVIGEVLPLARGAEALRKLSDRAAQGKVVLRVS